MKAWYTILMKLKNKLLIIYLIFLSNYSFASENFFRDAINLYENKETEQAKFLFQRNLVYNPSDALSYLYLAKIFQVEGNKKEMEKNLETTLLLDPINEEAMYMKIDIELKKSNFDEVKNLKLEFKNICSLMCNKLVLIEERLKNFDSPNES